MKIAELKILVASALLFVTASAQALQPEVLYGFQLGPRNPTASLVQGSDGNFYGTSERGGNGDRGTVFRVTTNGVLITLVSFSGTNGAHPHTPLVLGSDGDFYGTTYFGGSGATDPWTGSGTVFKVTTNGVLTSLVSFNNTNGAGPNELVLGSDSYFYGTTAYGGTNNNGTVFKMATNGVLTTLVSFSGTNGAHPQAGLRLGNDGNFYGTTAWGGSSYVSQYDAGYGTVFKITLDGVLTSLVSFNGTNGESPQAALVLGNAGNFYGTTYGGGSSGNGTVFRVTTNGVLTTLVSFAWTNGAYSRAGLVLGSDGNFYGTTESGGSSEGDAPGTVFKVTTNGVLTTLVSFAWTNGAVPRAGLVVGSDGNFHGTTSQGGSGGAGTVFKMTLDGVFTTLDGREGVNPNELVLGSDGHFYGITVAGGGVFRVTTSGALTTLVSFNYSAYGGPQAPLALGNDGKFYGTTKGSWLFGGPKPGTVFQVTTNGVLTTLVSFSFNYPDGAIPDAGLVLGTDGNFYGTTAVGGTGDAGTVFQVTTDGVLTTLVSFTRTNGAGPLGELALGDDGHFYGTTHVGGSGGVGTVFKVTTNGVLTSLVSFNGTNGATPRARLLLSSDGNFYGTTEYGGSGATGPWTGSGTVFKVTTNGVLTSLVSFSGTNGASPRARLLLSSDGNFYGTTYGGGSSGNGTVFRVTTNGVLTSLVSFAGSNGANPQAGLVLGRDGYFYGTTTSGGPGGGGTIFRLVISAFTSVARHPSGNVLLTGTGPLNAGYRLWASTDLSLPFASWTLLTSASFDSNGNFSYTDAGAAANPSRFYQLSVP